MSMNNEFYCKEHCIHYSACLWNGEYTPTPCRYFKDKADWVEVRHGEWIVVKEYNDYRMRYEAKIACSVCGHKPKYEGYLSDMKYCSNCGAKMDGERSENGT